MTIEIGQLRRWKENSGDPGELFLVIGFTTPTAEDEVFVDYIMNGEHCWDDDDWIEHYSEIVGETNPV